MFIYEHIVESVQVHLPRDFSERSVQTACSGRLSVVHTLNFLYVAFAATRTSRSVAQASSNSLLWVVYLLVMLKIFISSLTIVSLCLLFVLLNIFTPTSAGPFGILVIFIFVYLSSFGLMTFFLYWASRLISQISTIIVVGKPARVLSLRRSYFFASILSAAPVMLIGLKSVGAAGVYGYLLIAIFVAIGCLYISKRIV